MTAKWKEKIYEINGKKQTPSDRHVNLVKREIKAAGKIPTITTKK